MLPLNEHSENFYKFNQHFIKKTNPNEQYFAFPLSLKTLNLLTKVFNTVKFVLRPPTKCQTLRERVLKFSKRVDRTP